MITLSITLDESSPADIRHAQEIFHALLHLAVPTEVSWPGTIAVEVTPKVGKTATPNSTAKAAPAPSQNPKEEIKKNEPSEKVASKAAPKTATPAPSIFNKPPATLGPGAATPAVHLKSAAPAEQNTQFAVIAKQIGQLCTMGQRAAVTEALAKFGAKKGGELKPDQYAAARGAFDALLAPFTTGKA